MITIAYANFPTRYADELRNKGQRPKARAFWEYYYDMEKGEHNSVRFYSTSWGVGKSTAGRWVDEFKIKIDLYLNAWSLKNGRHHSSVKNRVGHLGQKERDSWDSDQPHNIGDSEEVVGQLGQQERDKVLNLNNNNNTAGAYWNDSQFNDLFFIYGINTKYKGKKEDAFEVFRHITVDVNLLKLAAVQYLHDPATEGKRYNLPNFLKNQTYLSYMPKMLRVKRDGEWIGGVYDENTMIFTGDSGFIGQLTPDRLVALYKSGELEFVNPHGKVE